MNTLALIYTTGTYGRHLDAFTTVSDREKAAARPIDGPFPEFAREIRHLLGYYAEDRRNFMTSRMAHRKTGVNYSTIASMTRGVRGSEDTIRKIAKGLGGDVDILLRLAGYESFSSEEAAPDPLSRIGPSIRMSRLDRIPVSRRIASVGAQRGAGDTEDEEESAASRIPSEARGIEVRGDCMEPFFHSGDVVFIRPQADAESGQKVVALLNDDSITCKVFLWDDTGAHLEATNGKYPRIDAPEFTILGVVVMVLKIV
ncbi:MAG: LexA family protein [Janthinobacterium lividum]